MKIYVGNMPYGVTEEDLKQSFAAFGEVTSVSIIKDKMSGQSKGFGFVEMASAEQGQAAISGMNGKELKGRKLNVNEARPRQDDGRGGGGGGMRRPGGGGGGRPRY
jgi:RNA recognition motif-containing protein